MTTTTSEFPPVLLVDDDTPFRVAVRKVLSRRGYPVEEARDGVEACQLLQTRRYGAVLLDLKMPRMDGLEVLSRYAASGPPFLMLTGHGTVALAVEAMRRGATSFLQKPFENEHLLALVGDACRSGHNPTSPEVERLVGESLVMLQVRSMLARVAPTDETVCLMGETGTGKELAARTLHAQSRRGRGAFVAVNCACVSRDLFESELFGHTRGSFTGAVEDRPGLFRQADGGTLFIDEVGELPFDCQAKLLRVLETHRVRAVGGLEEKSVDVRVVTATNRNLQAEVAAGRFREDLYFRLQVVPLVLPPLRERRDDIPRLVDHLMVRLGRVDSPHIAPGALEALMRYHWPGNVRELVNVLKRAVLFCQADTVDAALIQEVIDGSIFRFTPGRVELTAPSPEPGGPGPVAERSLEEVEREHITRLYDQLQGNVTRLAQVLAIDRRTLQRKLRAYGYAPKNPSRAPGDGI